MSEDQWPRARRRARSDQSYKFQRLREKIRQAVTGGTLGGKLPGERALAKQFRCNAKTLSKALTDLAAEGLLERSIGRGTFVKGTAPRFHSRTRWLLIGDTGPVSAALCRAIRQAHPDCDVTFDPTSLRPSYLSQVCAALLIATPAEERLLRDLLLRGIQVVSVAREPDSYSVHSVSMDQEPGVWSLGRQLLLAGHRRLAAVEQRNSTHIARTLRRAVSRYAPEASVDTLFPSEVLAAVEQGITGIVCDAASSAASVAITLRRADVAVPQSVSLGAVGYLFDDLPCSGYFLDAAKISETVVALLREPPARPAALWLSGIYQDRGTMGPLLGNGEIEMPALSAPPAARLA